EIAFVVVDADRPESFHGHVLDRQLIYGLAVILRRIEALIVRRASRIAAPTDGGADQMGHRINFFFTAMLTAGIPQIVASTVRRCNMRSANSAAVNVGVVVEKFCVLMVTTSCLFVKGL